MYSNIQGYKRVILFSHNSNLSGAPISLAQLAKRLPEYSYLPLFIIPKPGPLVRLLQNMGIEYKILKPGLKILDFICILCKAKPVLVHVNSLVTTWPVLIARMMRKPVIWHIREYLGDKKLYAHIVHLLSTRVILISHRQFSLFKKLKKSTLVLNGIDFSVFKNVEPLHIVKSKCYELVLVTYIGTIEPRKGLLILAQAAVLLKEKENIHFLVVGKTPDRYESYKEKIIAILKKNDILERFHFLGARDEIPQILAGSDILCHPALIEVFGRTVVEAMASKLPVVATRVGEIPWIIKDEMTGFIVNPGDYQALANALEKLATNKYLRENLGKKGYERAKNKYDIQIHARKIAKLYDEILTNE